MLSDVGFGCASFWIFVTIFAHLFTSNNSGNFHIVIWAVHGLSNNSCIRPTALVTGSTDGIGATTAQNLAAKGYNVLVHGRSEARISRAVQKIISVCDDSSNVPVRAFPLPVADISTVRGCHKLVDSIRIALQLNPELSFLTVVMNNAGVYEESRTETQDGMEMTFAVNVLAPFVITSLLLPVLLPQPKSRIVIASSISQSRSILEWDDVVYRTRGYSAHGAYSDSKLLDTMLSMEIASRLLKAGLYTDRITCNCLDPGTVNTKMLLAGWGKIGIDVEDALDQTYLCTSSDVADVSGEYFVWKSSRQAPPDAYKPEERAKLWTLLSDLAPSAAIEWDKALSITQKSEQ